MGNSGRRWGLQDCRGTAGPAAAEAVPPGAQAETAKPLRVFLDLACEVGAGQRARAIFSRLEQELTVRSERRLE